jgi:hypothetical protein
MEVAALVLLLIGGVLLPFVGWFVGVILLGLSNAWNVRDKVIGTVFVPGGGLGLSLFLLVFAGSASLSSGKGSVCEVDPLTGREINCTEFPSSGSSTEVVDVLKFGGFAAIVVAPIVTTAYLTYRLRRQPGAATT